MSSVMLLFLSNPWTESFKNQQFLCFVRDFPPLLESGNFITVFTDPFLIQVKPIHTSQPSYLRCTLILSSICASLSLVVVPLHIFLCIFVCGCHHFSSLCTSRPSHSPSFYDVNTSWRVQMVEASKHLDNSYLRSKYYQNTIRILNLYSSPILLLCRYYSSCY